MRSLSLLLLPIVLAGLGSSASAAVVVDSTSWDVVFGNGNLSNPQSDSLTWGNGSTNNITNSFLVATLDGDSTTAGNQGVTVHIGETLNFSGHAAISGGTGTNGGLQFRFGLYNDNGSSQDGFGWLGYFVGNATSSNPGGIFAKNSGNTAGYIVEQGSSTLQSFTSTAANLANGIYSFSLSLERTANSTMVISANLIREADGAVLASVQDLVHTSGAAPALAEFNRIGFLAAQGLEADQILLSEVRVTVVPEPSTSIFGLAAAGLFLTRRRH